MDEWNEFKNKLYSAKNKQELKIELQKFLTFFNGLLTNWEYKHKGEDIKDIFEKGLYPFYNGLSNGWIEYNEIVVENWKNKPIKDVNLKVILMSESFIQAVLKGEIPNEYLEWLPEIIEKIKNFDEIEDEIVENLGILKSAVLNKISDEDMKYVLKELKKIKEKFN